MKFLNWGPTTISHFCMSVTFYFSKSLHPNAHCAMRMRVKVLYVTLGITTVPQTAILNESSTVHSCSRLLQSLPQ